MNAGTFYHFDGTVCHLRGSCAGWREMSRPRRCGAEGAGQAAGPGPAVCGLPHGHPGPHLHPETGFEY
jgi:hypothetical protein